MMWIRVNQIDPVTGKVIKRYNSRTAAGKDTGIPPEKIDKACSDGRAINGLYFKFDTTLDINRSWPKTPEQIDKIIAYCFKKKDKE
jgi:hypothetical protein